jgi:hypothetical protein
MAKASKIDQDINQAIADLKNESLSTPEITKEKAEAIADFLKANPSVQKAYFNEDGAWSFHERAGFDFSVTREEILGLPPKETETSIEESAE